MGAAGSTANLSIQESVEIARQLKLEYEKCKALNLSPEEFQRLMTTKYIAILAMLQDIQTQGLKTSNTMELLRLSEFMSSSLKGFELNTKDLQASPEEELNDTPRDPWTETMNMRLSILSKL
jgi:hypothetical protein